MIGVREALVIWENALRRLGRLPLLILLGLVLAGLPTLASAKESQREHRAFGCTVGYYHFGGPDGTGYRAMRDIYGKMIHKTAPEIDLMMAHQERDLRIKLKSGEYPQTDLDALPSFCYDQFKVARGTVIDPDLVPFAQTQEEVLRGTLVECAGIYNFMTDGVGPQHAALLAKFGTALAEKPEAAAPEIEQMTTKIIMLIKAGTLKSGQIEGKAPACAKYFEISEPVAPPPPILTTEESDRYEVLGMPALGDAAFCAAQFFRQTGAVSDGFEAMVRKMRLINPKLSRYQAIAHAFSRVDTLAKQDRNARVFTNEEQYAALSCEQEFRVPSPVSIDAQREASDAYVAMIKRQREAAETARREAAERQAVREAEQSRNTMGNDANYSGIDSFLNTCMGLRSEVSPFHPAYAQWRSTTWECERGRSDGAKLAFSVGDSQRGQYYQSLKFSWE